MSFEPHSLLANGDWLEMIWPIAIMAVYGIGALVKMYLERSKEKPATSEKTDSESLPSAAAVPDKPRYKPLDEVAYPRPEAPQARTLPYARTAAKARPVPTEPLPVAKPVGEVTDWDRQQELKRRRQEQIEALRRQQAAEQQRRQILQQAALQQQREQQRRQAAAPAAPRPRAQTAPAAARSAAVRKTPQEALRQVRTGRPAGGGPVLSRHSVLQKPTSARPAVRAAQEPSRSEADIPISETLWTMLRRRDSLRSAVVLKEILDGPVGLRDL